MEDGRLARGKEIAAKRQVRLGEDGSWLVLSQSQNKVRYEVTARVDRCTCPDFEAWELPCKHIFAVRTFQGFVVPKEKKDDVPMSRPTYPQEWSAYNNAQINERDHFEQLLHELCSLVEQPKQMNGRPRHALGDVIYAAATKVYSTMSGRRASSEIRSCASKGLISDAIHHNSISHYLLMPELTPVLMKMVEHSALPLKAIETQFAVDSTGFSTCTYVRWFDHKYGTESRMQRWIKCHAMVGTRTNIVTSVQVTEGFVNDSTQLPELLASTAANFNIQEVSADKAYLSNLNLMAVESHGAVPFIPFKKNSVTATHSTSAWHKMWHMFWYRRDEFLAHYHRRSNVETTFSMIKRKFGGAVRSKKYESQVNEVLLKVLIHNIVVLIHEMYELGITPDFGTTRAQN